MRIALLSTCALSTPPKGYGGTEAFVSELASGLLALGHDVTTFATGDSLVAGEVRSVFPAPVWPPNPLAEQRHAARAFEKIRDGGFDVVHVNTAEALGYSEIVEVPTVLTIHHEKVPELVEHYAAFPEVGLIAISERQRTLSHELSFQDVIHHGLDPERFPKGDGDGGYCAFLGRFCEEKGPHRAIDAARKAGVSICVAGRAHEIAERYFEEELEPRLSLPGVEWIGEVGYERKLELLRGASSLLFPISWEEPFGLVMIEAMLVGTPVIAFDRGSVREVVDEGVTGYVVRSVDEMAERLRTIGDLDRDRCRARASLRFSHLRMAKGYIRAYRQAIREAERRSDAYASGRRLGQAS